MNLQSIEIIVGAVLPPFVDLINKHVKNSNWKYVISLLASLLIGAIINYQQLSIESVLSSGAIVFASAQTVYKTYWEDAKLREKIIK